MAKLRDLYANREAMRYKSPIPSREMILEVLQQEGKPLSKQQLEKHLQLKKLPQKEAFAKRLSAMERDGQLICNRQGNYGPVNKMNLIHGRVIGHKEGFGFVVPNDGSDDLFLPAQYMRAVFSGDTVLVRPTNIDRKGRRECALVQVLECNTQQIVGRLKKTATQLQFVIPENKKIAHNILIPKGEEKQAKDGQIVTVSITSQPTYQQQPIGKIIEVLGEERAPGMEIDIAIRSHSLPEQFPKEVVQELKESKTFKELKPHKVYPDRIDLRQLPLVTIDGEDAMDFDDAVYCEKKSGNDYRLIVAIADVSYYVNPDSALDKEAYARGNSVYFPGRVIPMLPEILSNGLCSLKPHLDRFCMVCDMTLNADAEITRYKFYSGVMHSHARLTYTQVSHALNNKENARESLGGLYQHIEVFHELYLKLLKNRQKRGALDFETVETKVLFDENKKIKNIVPVVRNDAHKMIEEAMLLANVCTAKYLVKHKKPSLFRTHEGPTEEKLNDLRHFLKEFGLGLQGASKPTSKNYAELLRSISKRKDAGLINTVLLRSLKQAVYSPENTGHFGLAYDAYTHFTSPIRRYPDLIIHRQLREILDQESTLTKKMKEDLEKKLHLMGEHCSFTERRADEATRDAMTALKCEFMSSRVGECFQGIVTGVTGFGLFVELTGVYVDGLIHITTLPSDYYYFDAAKHRLTGERSGLRFSLGDTLSVKVIRVDVEDKKIDLELSQENKNVKHKKKPK
jgi:ribonuclease R